MKLSMEIFAEWLANYNPRADIKSNLFEIETVRLFSGNITLNHNTLYVGRLSDFFRQGSRQIICVHNNDMILLGTEELEEVLDHALDALEYYTSWESRMMELLTSGAMLQDLYDASASLLPQPSFLVDAGQHLLAFTRKYKAGDVDRYWDQMMETGSMDLDFLIRLNQKYPEIQTREGLHTFDTDLFDYRSLVYNFFFMGSWTGSAVLIQKDGEISPGERDIFVLFCSYISRWFESHIEEQQASIIDTLLGAVITDEGGNQEELCRKLLLVGWKKKDPLLFLKLDAPFVPFNINRHLCRTLSMHFQNAFAVINELSVCLLCNLAQMPYARLRTELEPILFTSKYYGVRSRVFTMEDILFKHFKYTEMISDYCGREPGVIYDGDDFVLPYVLSELQHTIIPDVTHPALKKLREYDKSHRTAFYETLYIYLKNERSPLAAARELGLHRNSFAYRLKRLEELVDADLEDAMTRLHLLLSFELSK